MSIDSTRIHCTGCEYEYIEHYRPITLNCRMDCGIVSYSTAQAWCHRCKAIRYAEYIPTIDEIRGEYQEWYEVSVNPLNGWRKLLKLGDRRFRESQKQLECMLAWREARKAPPHCLSCGSTDLAELDFVELSESSEVTRTFRHHCGGFLVHDFEDKTGMHFHFSPKEIWMDIEGNKLSVE